MSLFTENAVALRPEFHRDEFLTQLARRRRSKEHTFLSRSMNE